MGSYHSITTEEPFIVPFIGSRLSCNVHFFSHWFDIKTRETPICCAVWCSLQFLSSVHLILCRTFDKHSDHSLDFLDVVGRTESGVRVKGPQQTEKHQRWGVLIRADRKWEVGRDKRQHLKLKQYKSLFTEEVWCFIFDVGASEWRNKVSGFSSEDHLCSTT